MNEQLNEGGAITRLTGKPQLNRFVNRRLILDKIRRVGEISRADLAKQTAIRPPTVSAVIKVLMDEGLVEEVGAGETSGGRTPRLLAISRRQPRALGFEMSESSVLAVLCDLHGDVCAKRHKRSKAMTPAQAVEELHELGDSLLAECGVDWSDLQGVGVALPGHLNATTGEIRWSTTLQWQDVPFKAMCEESWGIVTDVINDSSAGGMASHLFESDKMVKNLAFLYLRFQDEGHKDVGVGVGVIVNDIPYHGEFGAAGEITIPIRHPLAYEAKPPESAPATLDEFLARLGEREPAATAVFKGLSTELSILAGHIVNLLEPGILVIGSDCPALRDLLLEQIEASLERYRLPFQAGKTQLAASTLGQYGVARGAIVPTLQRLFRMPQLS